MTFKYSQEEQKVFYQSIKNNEPTLIVGPRMSGKTHFANLLLSSTQWIGDINNV